MSFPKEFIHVQSVLPFQSWGLGKWVKIGIPNNFDKLMWVKINMTKSIKGKLKSRGIPDYRNEYKMVLNWVCINIANNCIEPMRTVGQTCQ